MTFRVPTRADDEVLLQMLDLRRNFTARQIGAAFGKRPEFVRGVTNEVIKDDTQAEGRDTRAEYGFLDQSKAIRSGMAA